MAWIESNQELGRHPKTKKLARLLDTSEAAVVGHLHYLWWWAMDFAQDGNLGKYYEFEIADACMWPGDHQSFVDALIKAGFLDKTEQGLFIHDWFEYTGRLMIQRAMKRKKTRERVRRFREKEKCNSEVHSSAEISNLDVNRLHDANGSVDANTSAERCSTTEMCNAYVNESSEKCNDEINASAEACNVYESKSAEMCKDDVSLSVEILNDDTSSSVEIFNDGANKSVEICDDEVNPEISHPDVNALAEACKADLSSLGETGRDDVTFCNAPTVPNRTVHYPTVPDRTVPNPTVPDITLPNLFVVDDVNARVRASKIDSGTSLPAPVGLKLVEMNRPEKSRAIGTQAVDWAEKNWGRIIPKGDADSILAWCDEFLTSGSEDPDAVVIEGLKCCLDADARNMRYLRAVLTDWQEAGILSVEQIKAREAEYKSKKNSMRIKEPVGQFQSGQFQSGIDQSGKTESSKYENFYL